MPSTNSLVQTTPIKSASQPQNKQCTSTKPLLVRTIM